MESSDGGRSNRYMLSKNITRLFWFVVLGILLVMPYVLGNRGYRYLCKKTAYIGAGVLFPFRSFFTENSMPDYVMKYYFDEYLTNMPSYQYGKLSDVKILLIRQRESYQYILSCVVSDALRSEMLSKMNPAESVMYVINSFQSKTDRTDDICNALLISGQSHESNNKALPGLACDYLSTKMLIS